VGAVGVGAGSRKRGGRSARRDTLVYVVLGFLRIRPMTGYDIKSVFERTARYLWNASSSQIYGVLNRLEREGLVETTVEVREGRPARKVARLTALGEELLSRWLGEPVAERYMKDDFLAKLFFLGFARPGERRRVLQEQRESILRQQAVMEMAQKAFRSRPTRRREVLAWQLLTVEFAKGRLKADLETIERALRALEEGEGCLSGEEGVWKPGSSEKEAVGGVG